LRRLAKVSRIPIGYVLVRRRDPLGVIRLFSPRTWSTGIRLVKTALGKAKW
jgi:hypothetical protein